MNHRVVSIVFGSLVGAAVALWSYQWLTDPDRDLERQQEERVVLLARELLVSKLGVAKPELVDPLAPKRKVGKAYIFATADGWQVSGYYRRDSDDGWHPFLMTITAGDTLQSLKVQDSNAELLRKAAVDPLLEVLP